MTGATGSDPAVGLGQWWVDIDNSTASFSVRNFGLKTVRGRVPIVSAAVDVDGRGQVTAVRATLDLSGVDTGNSRRDKDLSAPKLLDTGRHPSLTFDGGPAEPSAVGWRLPGRLGARGASADVVLDVVVEGRGDTVAGGSGGGANTAPSGRATLRATTRFDRRHLSVRAPRFMIGHEVTVDIRVELVEGGEPGSDARV